MSNWWFPHNPRKTLEILDSLNFILTDPMQWYLMHVFYGDGFQGQFREELIRQKWLFYRILTLLPKLWTETAHLGLSRVKKYDLSTKNTTIYESTLFFSSTLSLEIVSIFYCCIHVTTKLGPCDRYASSLADDVNIVVPSIDIRSPWLTWK